MVGRKNWLFYGSDLHPQAAAAIFTLLASCRLHGIDPVKYLDELLRLLPYWPRARYLELAPFRWVDTSAELKRLVGAITVAAWPLGRCQAFATNGVRAAVTGG